MAYEPDQNSRVSRLQPVGPLATTGPLRLQ